VEQECWVEWFDREVDNLRQAFDWAVRAADGQLALRIATGLGRLWRIRGRPRESYQQFKTVLALNPDVSSHERARLLDVLARLTVELDEYAIGESAATEALALAEGIDDRFLICRALNTRSSIARRRSDYAQAGELAARSLANARALGERRLLQDTLNVAAGVSFDQGDRTTAQELMREAYELYTDDDPVDERLAAVSQLAAALIDGDPETVILCDEVLDYARRHGYLGHEAWGHMTLGYYRLLTGDLDDAQVHSRAALALYHEIGNRWAWAGTLCNVALIEWVQGDQFGCIENGRLALRTMWTLGDRRYVGLIVSHLGGMCRVASTPTANIRLLSAGVAELTAIDSSPDAALSGRDVAWKEELCAEVGDEAFDAAWARGQGTPIGVAVEAILSDAEYPD
jgi:tetratricopeptide (TPR) repeat protein